MCWEAPGDILVKAGAHLADLHKLSGKGEHKLGLLAAKASRGGCDHFSSQPSLWINENEHNLFLLISECEKVDVLHCPGQE